MNDEEVREAVEYYQNSIALGNQGHIKTLVTLAQLYLANAGKMPKEIPPEMRIVQPLSEISFNKGRIQGHNQARQSCILAFTKREQELIEGIKSLEIQGNDLADGVIALSKAICPDSSITLVTELVDFAKDLWHAYKVVSKLGEEELKDRLPHLGSAIGYKKVETKDICDICQQDIIDDNKSDSDYAICKKCLISLQDDNS